jgi:hypothetical protein
MGHAYHFNAVPALEPNQTTWQDILFGRIHLFGLSGLLLRRYFRRSCMILVVCRLLREFGTLVLKIPEIARFNLYAILMN